MSNGKLIVSVQVKDLSQAKWVAGEWVAMFNQDATQIFVVRMLNLQSGGMEVLGHWLGGAYIDQEAELEMLDVLNDLEGFDKPSEPVVETKVESGETDFWNRHLSLHAKTKAQLNEIIREKTGIVLSPRRTKWSLVQTIEQMETHRYDQDGRLKPAYRWAKEEF